jgi:preprotein translocase subunit SecG
MIDHKGGKMMKRWMKCLAVALFVCVFAVTLGACSKDDPVEDAGKKMENAFDDAKKAVKDAVD